MARALKRLTAVSIAALKTPGRHADGGNLYLTVSKTPGGLSKHWTFLFTLDGKQREAGFWHGHAGGSEREGQTMAGTAS